MEEIPKITPNLIVNLDDTIKSLISRGDVTKWLDEQLGYLANNNPVLYRYVLEHTQRLAMGASMAPDPQSVALSMCLEEILLLNLINNGLKGGKDLKKFEDVWGKFFPNGLKGNEFQG